MAAIDDIREDIRDMRKDLQDLRERVAAHEAEDRGRHAQIISEVHDLGSEIKELKGLNASVVELRTEIRAFMSAKTPPPPPAPNWITTLVNLDKTQLLSLTGAVSMIVAAAFAGIGAGLGWLPMPSFPSGSAASAQHAPAPAQHAPTPTPAPLPNPIAPDPGP